MNAVKEGVLRLANASYYVGRGEYELFVQDSKDEIVKRKVQLGDSNFEYVEVISGLKPGDKVVVSDMSSYKNKNKHNRDNCHQYVIADGFNGLDSVWILSHCELLSIIIIFKIRTAPVLPPYQQPSLLPAKGQS